MSQSTARHTRREIRRAIGPSGLDAVNLTSQVVHDHVLPTLQAHTDQITGHERQFTRHWEVLEAARLAQRTFRAMTFRQRVRWFFTGWSPLV